LILNALSWRVKALMPLILAHHAQFTDQAKGIEMACLEMDKHWLINSAGVHAFIEITEHFGGR